MSRARRGAAQGSALEHAGNGQRRQREHGALRGARVERHQAQVARLAVLVLHLRRICPMPQVLHPLAIRHTMLRI